MNEQRLGTVLRVRSLRERLARSEVARRRMELESRREAEAAAWTALGARAEHAPRSATGFVAHRAMLDAGAHEALAAGAQVTEASNAVGTAMSIWRDEARRLDGIERLAERVRAEAQAERDRVERNEIDDLVVMRGGGQTDEVGS